MGKKTHFHAMHDTLLSFVEEPPNGRKIDTIGVLPMVTPGGVGVTIGRTFI